MSDLLKGKVAFLTAAGQGIGRATALRFAEACATVWATDINQAALNALKAAHSSIQTRLLDVRDNAAIEALSAEVGTIDVLFNCAGYVHQGNIFECSENDWSFSLDLNVASMYRTCRAFLPGMLTARRGSIINMSSIVSSLKSAPNRFVYATSKAAVIGLTKAIAADFVSQGIRCNALCPGTVETPSLDDRIASQGDLATARASFIARQPMGRLGKPEEIAAAALYLASDQSSFTTGQTLIIDGGWSIQLAVEIEEQIVALEQHADPLNKLRPKVSMGIARGVRSRQLGKGLSFLSEAGVIALEANRGFLKKPIAPLSK